MERLEVTFKVITPLFLSGANQAQAEFRLASLKGAMRYWYRALDPNYRKREAEIFGGTGKGEGQAKFLLRWEPVEWEQKMWDKDEFSGSRKETVDKSMTGIIYLSYSMDLTVKKVRVQRPYLLPGTEFTILLLFRDTTAEMRKAVLGALWMLGHVGGLGSRSRRGLGTIALKDWNLLTSGSWPELNELPIAHKAETLEEWRRFFKEGIQVLNSWFGSSRKVTHTVLDNNCRFLLVDKAFTKENGYEGWVHALNHAGQLMQDFRLRWEPDYTNVKQHICALDTRTAMLNKDVKPIPMRVGPQRAAFGLPLTFKYTSLKGCNKITFQGTRKYHRSGSPVWIRVIEIGNEYYPFFAFLSSPLLPPQVKIIDSLSREKSSREKSGIQGHGKNEALPKPSQQILADFQQYLMKKAQVLEVK